MAENISPEQYQAEIDALNIKLDLAKNQLVKSAYADHFDPFKNPTEYRHYRDNYTSINPDIKKPFTEIPLNPEYLEKRNIKKFYNNAGFQLVGHIILSNIMMYILSITILTILQFSNSQASYRSIAEYFYSTSIAPVNMITFMICNILFASIGLKISKTSPSSLFKTRGFSFVKAVAYCLIALFIQHFTSIITSFISDIMSQCGLTMYNVNDYTDFQSTSSQIVEFVYAIIVAPLTEEFFYRGMILKNLSKASQRFGIFMSAFLFGLMHATIPQIILGFVMGIFLAHITIKHNSIIPSIIVHAFNNSLGYILEPLDNITSETGIFIANIIYAMLIMFGLLALLRFKLTNKLPSTTPQQSRRGLSLAIQSVPLIITVVYYIFETISYILQIS